MKASQSPYQCIGRPQSCARRASVDGSGRTRLMGAGDGRCGSTRLRGQMQTCSDAGGCPARRRGGGRHGAPSRSRCGCAPAVLSSWSTSQSTSGSLSSVRRERTVESAARERLARSLEVREANMCSTVGGRSDGSGAHAVSRGAAARNPHREAKLRLRCCNGNCTPPATETTAMLLGRSMRCDRVMGRQDDC